MVNIFGLIVHEGKLIVDGVKRMFGFVEHEVIVLTHYAITTFGKDAVEHALTYGKEWLDVHAPQLAEETSDHVRATLQHEFVKSSLIEKSGIAAAISNFLAAQANHLLGPNGSNVKSLIDQGFKALENKATADPSTT
jgi:hypothetical protein